MQDTILCEVDAVFSRSVFFRAQDYYGKLKFMADGGVVFNGSGKTFLLKDVTKDLRFAENLSSIEVFYPRNVRLVDSNKTYNFWVGQQYRNKYGITSSRDYAIQVIGGNSASTVNAGLKATDNEQLLRDIVSTLTTAPAFSNTLITKEVMGVKTSKLLLGLSLSYLLYIAGILIFLTVIIVSAVSKMRSI